MLTFPSRVEGRFAVACQNLQARVKLQFLFTPVETSISSKIREVDRSVRTTSPAKIMLLQIVHISSVACHLRPCGPLRVIYL